MSTIDKAELIAIRLMNENDKGFIYATWLKGLYYGDTWFKEVPKDLFMKGYRPIIDKLLSSPDTVVTVACLKDDPEVILGYAVQKLDCVTVHWVFVKQSWRGIGLAKSLISPKIGVVTHLTRAGLGILKNHCKIIFNPFAI
jgi:GNAT superfamily N-acetyltransferase